jgi:hypothetical protein
MGKVKDRLEQFLIAIDATGEGQLRDIMGDEYIDTPGFYSIEGSNYDGVFDFMRANMGISEFGRLIEWVDRNPDKVEKIIAPIFGYQTN